MPKIISHTKKNVTSPLPWTDSLYNDQKIPLLLTCQSWLESLVRRESERFWLTETSGQDRLVYGIGNLETLYKLLIGSRFANRVYIEVAKEKIVDFDTLHDTLARITWSEYLTGKEIIVIEASSTRSVLSSVPTIQSVSQNAIYSTLHTPNNAHAIEVHILILIIDDIAHVLLDITGNPLHKRGYREEAGEAPLKESLAAALVAFSGWRYRNPLIDPFCGSGTIAIEAAMMARNIPPGLSRSFRIESLPIHQKELLGKVKKEWSEKIYPSGPYKIYAQDISPDMIEMAKRNAERAGVGKDVTFSVSDYLNPNPPLTGSEWKTIVTNPPYGNRLESDDLDAIYKKLIMDAKENGWWFITTYPIDVRFWLANKKLLNGSEECRFWYRKN